jgi:hypothetical protein
VCCDSPRWYAIHWTNAIDLRAPGEPTEALANKQGDCGAAVAKHALHEQIQTKPALKQGLTER